MESINRHNYEEYMIDFLEDNLSAALKAEMQIFLSHNPDIKEEIEGLEDMHLSHDEISFTDKESLYKSEDASSFENRCISYLENEFTPEYKTTFEQEVSLDKGKESLLDDYTKTILVADESIIFTNKEKLKRNYAFRFKKLINFASAASIILAISLSVLFVPTEIHKSELMGSNTEVFNMPKEDIPEEIISKPEKAFLPNAPKIKKEIPVVKDEIAKLEQPKKTRLIKKTSERIVISIADINIPNTIAYKEITIKDDYLHSDDKIRTITREISLYSSAEEWTEYKDIVPEKEKRKKKNIFSKSGNKIKSVIGKYFYTRKVSHTREIIINNNGQ
jgi:hypothetical protein